MRSALTEPANTQVAAPRPPTQVEKQPMSYAGVLHKSVGLLAVMLAAAWGAWVAGPEYWGMIIPVGVVVSLVTGLVLAFKKEPSPLLTVVYTVFQGAAIGAFSGIFELQYDGIVTYALMATVCTFASLLGLFYIGVIRTSPKLTKIVVVAIMGYGVFSLLNFALVQFGVMDGMGMRDYEVMGMPIGLPISIIAVLLAAYALVMDFENIQNGVRSQMPKKFEWTGSWSLVATLMWMYVEFLRIFSYLFSNN